MKSTIELAHYLALCFASQLDWNSPRSTRVINLIASNFPWFFVLQVAAVGKPVVLVVVAGHTLALETESRICDAVLYAFLPSVDPPLFANSDASVNVCTVPHSFVTLA